MDMRTFADACRSFHLELESLYVTYAPRYQAFRSLIPSLHYKQYNTFFKPVGLPSQVGQSGEGGQRRSLESTSSVGGSWHGRMGMCV